MTSVKCSAAIQKSKIFESWKFVYRQFPISKNQTNIILWRARKVQLYHNQWEFAALRISGPPCPEYDSWGWISHVMIVRQQEQVQNYTSEVCILDKGKDDHVPLCRPTGLEPKPVSQEQGATCPRGSSPKAVAVLQVTQWMQSTSDAFAKPLGLLALMSAHNSLPKLHQ